jgi:hypothetical protein
MLVLLAILIFVYHFAAAIYQLSGSEPSALVEFLYIAGFLCAAIWWLRSETRRSAVTPVYCHGLLMNVGWFVMLPYHLLKTRGAKGLLPLLLLIGSYVLSQIAAAVVYIALIGGPTAY